MILLLERLFLWFLFYSFAGWVYESILVSCRERRLVNRGFLNGPLCPIYGTGAVLAIVLLGHMRSVPLIFLISMAGATVLEYVTSWTMERLFHARWWDYSNFRFNIQGRVCLLGAVVFGIGGVVIVLGVQPWVAAATDMIPPPVLHALAAVLLALVVADTAVTVTGMIGIERVLDSVAHAVQEAAARAGETWQWGPGAVAGRLHEFSHETRERLHAAVAGVVNAQQRRMLKSFPKFQVPGRQEIIDSLRELLRRH